MNAEKRKEIRDKTEIVPMLRGVYTQRVSTFRQCELVNEYIDQIQKETALAVIEEIEKFVGDIKKVSYEDDIYENSIHKKTILLKLTIIKKELQ